MARYASMKTARENAQANANATGAVWRVFSDTSGVANSERDTGRWLGASAPEYFRPILTLEQWARVYGLEHRVTIGRTGCRIVVGLSEFTPTQRVALSDLTDYFISSIVTDCAYLCPR